MINWQYEVKGCLIHQIEMWFSMFGYAIKAKWVGEVYMQPILLANVVRCQFPGPFCVLLINICNLSPPATGWRQTPSSSNGSLCWGRHFENEAFQKFLVCACHEDIHWWSQLQQLLEWQSRCVGEISRGEVWRPDEKNENWVHGSWCWRRLQKPFKRKAKIKWWH